MSAGRHELHGELAFTIEAAAECYRVEVAWIEEIRAAGFLTIGAAAGERSSLAEADLDRIARVLRWNRHLGVDLALALVLVEE